MELAPSLPELLRCEVHRRLGELDGRPAAVLDLGELLDEQSALVALLAALVGDRRRYTDLGRVLLPADHALLSAWQPIAARQRIHVHDGRRSPLHGGAAVGTADVDIALIERLGEGPVRLNVGDGFVAVSGLHPAWLATWRRQGIERPTWLADHKRVALLPVGTQVRLG